MTEDRFTNTPEDAALFERHRSEGPPERPDPSEYMEDDDDDPRCTWCAGEGICMDGADPLGDCPDDPHRCHACRGSGRSKDQVIF